jgi:hypothetical protein
MWQESSSERGERKINKSVFSPDKMLCYVDSQVF